MKENNFSHETEIAPEDKRNKIMELITGIKERQPELYKNDTTLKIEYTGYSFLDKLLEKIINQCNSKILDTESERVSKEIVTILEPNIKDELVLDLGCGVDGSGYRLADYLQAAGYIGVEMNFAQTANNRCRSIKSDTPYVITQEDMGDFIKSFKDSTIKAKTIILSGIDKYSCTGNAKYNELLQYIYESLQEDGILIVGGNLGTMMTEEKRELGKIFKEKLINVDIGNFIVFEKQKNDS